MVFIPTTIIGRVLLGTILFLYLCLLVLNLVSFGGLNWITYFDYNIQFGLWTVCYGAASAVRTCNQWSGSQTISDAATNTVIFSGKPGYIQAAEGLEIISLIFYIFAGVLIIMGIIDLDRAPLEYMFGAAAILLFLCIIFISASLGVMGNQGRSNHPGASLGWAWGVGLAGVIITVLCFLALVAFIVYIIRFYDSSLDNPKDFAEMTRQHQQQTLNSLPPVTMPGIPSLPPYQYPLYNQWPSEYPTQQFNPPTYLENQFLPYTGINQLPYTGINQLPYIGANQLPPYTGINQQQPPSMLAALVRQRLSDYRDTQHQ